MITTYNTISNNGYIAREDGNEDFIPDEAWDDFIEECGKHDAIVLGRKSYEAVQGYDPKLIQTFEELPIKKVILTTNRKYKPKSQYQVTHSLQDAAKMGFNLLVSSGPSVNLPLLKKGLIDKIVFDVLPESIPSGIKPFEDELIDQIGLAETVESKGGNRKLVTYCVIHRYENI